jgi:hypothetical protein
MNLCFIQIRTLCFTSCAPNPDPNRSIDLQTPISHEPPHTHDRQTPEQTNQVQLREINQPRVYTEDRSAEQNKRRASECEKREKREREGNFQLEKTRTRATTGIDTADTWTTVQRDAIGEPSPSMLPVNRLPLTHVQVDGSPHPHPHPHPHPTKPKPLWSQREWLRSC